MCSMVLALMALLAEALDDEPDGSIRAVARAFARRVARIRLGIQMEEGQSREEALSEAFC